MWISPILNSHELSNALSRFALTTIFQKWNGWYRCHPPPRGMRVVPDLPVGRSLSYLKALFKGSHLMRAVLFLSSQCTNCRGQRLSPTLSLLEEFHGIQITSCSGNPRVSSSCQPQGKRTRWSLHHGTHERRNRQKCGRWGERQPANQEFQPDADKKFNKLSTPGPKKIYSALGSLLPPALAG